MITFSLFGSKDEPFRVRFQTRSTHGGWVDAEVNEEVGQSQIYGIDRGISRVVIESMNDLNKGQVKIIADDGGDFKVTVQRLGPAGDWIDCESRYEIGCSPEFSLERYRYVVETANGVPLNADA